MTKGTIDANRSFSMPHISQGEVTAGRTQTAETSRPRTLQSSNAQFGNLPPSPHHSRPVESGQETEERRLFTGPSSTPTSSRFNSSRIGSTLDRLFNLQEPPTGDHDILHTGSGELIDLEAQNLEHAETEHSRSPAPPPHTESTPPAGSAVAGGSELTPAEQRNAGLASVMHQFIVSGTSWGISRKLFEEFAPAVGKLIGSKTGAAAGAAYGQIAGAALGNMLGGVALGATHYMAEHGVKKLRLALGKGTDYAPKISSAAMREAIFIATFSTFMACKAIARSSLPKQENGEEDAALAYALDIGFSAFGGAAAEAITQSLGKGFAKISANWSWDEFKTRITGGAAAGAASAFGDINSDITEAKSSRPGASLAAAGLGGAMNSIMALGSWFVVRRVMNDHYAAKAAASAAAQPTAVNPPVHEGTSVGGAQGAAHTDDTPPLTGEELQQLEQFMRNSAQLATVNESLEGVQLAQLFARGG